MFNVFKGIKGKAVASNNPLGDIAGDIERAKVNKANKDEENGKNESLYAKVFQNGVMALQELITENGYTKEKFDKCLDNLLKATQLKSTEPAPYYYLAFILNICGEKEEAIKYFDLVNYIDPDFDGLEALHQEIYDLDEEEPTPEEEVDALFDVLDNLKFAEMV